MQSCPPLRTSAPAHRAEKDEEGTRDTAFVRSEVQGCPQQCSEFKGSMGHITSCLKTAVKQRRDFIVTASRQTLPRIFIELPCPRNMEKRNMKSL